ncbi:MAG: extracellular solute-binding protein [Candidatus Marinimicrobia bacterium]|jgi:arabinogalactan oligomer/maltooligosaccharide transport system permease protein|nr:extracellular solute-binding protein [Candidatus Neomarinimicrobiota bacterium]
MIFKKIIYAILGVFFISCFDGSTEKSTINIWHQMHYENRKVLREVCNWYEDENPGIQINLTYRETEELRSNYQSSAMGGSGPELIYGPSDQVGPFAAMGIIQPLDTLFTDDFFNTFVDNAIISYQGHKWMVGDVVGNHLMLLYNKNLVTSPPQNTDELIAMGKEYTLDVDGDGKIDRYGLVWNFTEPFFYAPWLGGFGGWLLDYENQPTLNTEANRKGFAFIKSLRDEHKIIPQECDYEIANAMFLSGEAAMIINGDWSWGNYKGKVDFGIARIPMVSETGLWPTPIVGTKGYSINTNVQGRELEEVNRLLQFLTSAKVQLYFTEKVNSQPSSKAALKDERIAENEILKASARVVEAGRPMAVVPEMRAIWDALRTQYQAVLGGSATPENAASLAQKNALKQIQLMNEVQTPGNSIWIFRLGMFLLGGIILLLLIKNGKDIAESFRENKTAYLFIAPAFVMVFAIIIFPFFYNILISFSNFSLNTFRDWQIIGFHHYVEVFTDLHFYTILIKTGIWTFTNLFFHLGIGILLAVLINRTLPAKPLLRTALIIPWAVPQYISALTWRGMFNQEYGSVNMILEKFLFMEGLQWLSSPTETFIACILTNVWLGFPFMMIVALGGLQSIPTELYEAAEVDGASRWQQFKCITLPMLMPVMIPAMILGMIWTFNNINVVWLVSNGGEPSDQTHILVSFVYKAAFNLYRYGYAAALSMIIFCILLVMGIYSIRQSNSTESVY